MRTSLRLGAALFAALLGSGTSSPRTAFSQSAANRLERRYKAGDTLRYEMTGSNHGWEYRIEAKSTVQRDSDGVFYEDIGWSNLRSNAPMTLSPESLAFRQRLSMAYTAKYLSVPNLSTVQPFLIGPITDLLTMYADVFLTRETKLVHVGQHAYFEHGKPNSWADGQRVVLGQDAIDFDLTFESEQDGKAVFLVRHVPPKHPQIKLPAAWMEAPVATAPNNWVQVEKSGSAYMASVGKEVFDVRITLDTNDGKILSAQLHNPVVQVTRECKDAELLTCGEGKNETIVRDVKLELLP